MVSRILITAAWVSSLLVIASFALFVHDQLISGSKHQQAIVADGDLHVQAPAKAKHTPGQPRRFIVGAAHNLTSPFSSIVSSSNDWVNEIVPTALALLVFGGGLGFAARYTKGIVYRS